MSPSTFDPAYWNLILGGVGVLCLCSLIPFIRSETSEEVNNFYEISQVKIFDSPEFRVAGMALLMSSCPMILDMIMDYFDNHLSKSSKRDWVGRGCYATIIFTVLKCRDGHV